MINICEPYNITDYMPYYKEKPMCKQKGDNKMIEFHGLVNNKRIFIARTLSQLKRLASRYCNNDYKPMDEMRVTIHDVDKCENTDILYFHRFNKVCPNNTIERGKWE